MATATLRPNGDVTTGLASSSGGTHYTAIDDAVTQPTAGNTSDYVQGLTADAFDLYDMETITDASISVTALTVWCYGRGINATGNDYVDIKINGAFVAQRALGFTTSSGWKSTTYSGTWTKAQLDGLQVKLRSNGFLGNGARFETMYVEATYTVTESFVPQIILY